MLVYDVGNLKSLENALKWMELYNQHKERSSFCVAVGNKTDLPERYPVCYSGPAQRKWWRRSWER